MWPSANYGGGHISTAFRTRQRKRATSREFQVAIRSNQRIEHPGRLVDVNDLAIRYESLTIAGNDDRDERAYRKGARDVHVTSLAANFCHSTHDAAGARSFDEFGDGENGITRHGALNIVRLP
jgi:hypothetical protein